MAQLCNVVPVVPPVVETGHIISPSNCYIWVEDCVRCGNVVTFDAIIGIPTDIANGATVLKMPWKTVSRKDYNVMRWNPLLPTNYDRISLCIAANTDEIILNQGSTTIPDGYYFTFGGTYITAD